MFAVPLYKTCKILQKNFFLSSTVFQLSSGNQPQTGFTCIKRAKSVLHVKNFEKCMPKIDEFCYTGVFEVADYKYDDEKQPPYTWGSLDPGINVFYGNYDKFFTKLSSNLLLEGVFWVPDYKYDDEKRLTYTWGSPDPGINVFYGNYEKIFTKFSYFGGFQVSDYE